MAADATSHGAFIKPQAQPGMWRDASGSGLSAITLFNTQPGKQLRKPQRPWHLMPKEQQGTRSWRCFAGHAGH